MFLDGSAVQEVKNYIKEDIAESKELQSFGKVCKLDACKTVSVHVHGTYM